MKTPDCQYDTLLEAVEDLKKQGYTDELTIREDGLYNDVEPLDPKEFTIDSSERCEHCVCDQFNTLSIERDLGRRLWIERIGSHP